MALPTLTSSWATRKNFYEHSIVNRRNKESDFREKWANTAGYFQKSNVEVTKQNGWTSDKSFHNSMDAYKAIFQKENKLAQLKRRRLKLADMLQKEKLAYEAELKDLADGNFNLEDMRERVDELKSAREEKRKQVASEKLYEHWKQNHPELRKIEQDQLVDHVVEAWSGQVEEKEEKLESARKEKEEYEREMEEERQAAITMAMRREERKREEERQLKAVLKSQMEELQLKEAQAEKLKREQEALIRQQWEIEQMEEQRKFLEQKRMKQEHGRVLLRQHIAHMRRRSRQIQEELELDRQILESLLEKEQFTQRQENAKKAQARADAAWMKQVIEDQIRLEKAREAELDMLYQDEAARMWQKREAEWEKERRAREKLMKEVLAERQIQIEDKMEDLRLQQEDSLQRREELLQEMEVANQMTRREQEQTEALKSARKQELEEQIWTRRGEAEARELRLRLEDEAERVDQEQEEELLRQETERMRRQAFTPRVKLREKAGVDMSLVYIHVTSVVPGTPIQKIITCKAHKTFCGTILPSES
ncbi:trichoplein keratin filament-binding protein-like [Liolophura sinensis]|uniref:trichoplein keratin filament-binding protein-like n=1 Tax=Liolophura sinensis TaxID=3198878 RepID=UPI0031597D1C